eukprot:GFUD01006354.1.p1 GENE.GFUD01006354.1~~GFUD01006354.1.p1  ORF type:complete len:442 (+),score=100.05 GFUD01006354.1:171-1496(+)
MRSGSIPKIFTQTLAVLVTIWFCSHLFYVVDEGYRTALRGAWRANYGHFNYNMLLTPQKMQELHSMKRRDFLQGHNAARSSERPWRKIEDLLESSLIQMFERTDPMKGWELKKLGNAAWKNVSKELKVASKSVEVSPNVKDVSSDKGVDMSNVLVYNRIPKSGSTMMLGLLYELGKSLGYLVLRGKYHSYRYFGKNDRPGLGYFLEQASTRAKTVYVQHQYYVNFTLNRQQQPIYINIMRDPVEHLISSYYYKRTVILQNKSPQEMTEEERRIVSEPVEQCVIERRLECVYYGYTVHKNKTQQLQFRKTWSPTFLFPSDVLLYFCGHDEECTQLGNPLALQRAKHNVDKNFAVVGLLEHLNETMTVLEYKLPRFFQGVQKLYKKQKNEVMNKNSVKSSSVSKQVRSALKQRLSSEYELYSHIKQKLFKQYADIISQQIPAN